MCDIEKSQFESLVPEDSKQYRECFKKYKNMMPEDIESNYQLAKESLMLSQRWSDISSNASLYAKTFEISKTDFKDWSYQRYRNLQEMHTDCRVFYRDGRDDLKSFGRIE